MKYRYQYIDEMVDMIEGTSDPVIKMAVLWANQDQAQLKSLMYLLYDYRWNFEIGGVPNYRKNRTGGMEFHKAIDLLESRLNTRLLGADTKFKFLTDVFEQLQDRDAEVLARALQHQINFRIPLKDIRRAFPGIQTGPGFAEDAPIAVLSELKFPGTIVRQQPGHEVRVVINGTGNFKFVDHEGHGLVLPNKPNSAFCSIFKGLKNVVICASFFGLTKDQDKIGNTATTNAAFAKFKAGELEKETISIKILDCMDRWTYDRAYLPEARKQAQMTWAYRSNWIDQHDWQDTIFCKVADRIDIANLEDLRKYENEVFTTKDTLRYYANDSLFADGYHILDKSAF